MQCIWKMCWHVPYTTRCCYMFDTPLNSSPALLTERTIISREFTIRTARVVRDSTDTADVFVVFLLFTQLPSPLRNSIPFLDGHFHTLTFLRLRSCHLRNYLDLAEFKEACFVLLSCFPMSVPGNQGVRLRKPPPASSISTTPKARPQDEALLKDAVRKYVVRDGVPLNHN